MSGIWPVMSEIEPARYGTCPVMSRIRPVVSGIWPVMSGAWPGNDNNVWKRAMKNWPCSRHRTLMSRIKPVFCWSYSAHCTLMSGIWPGKTGLISVKCHVLAMFWTSTMSWTWPGWARGLDPIWVIQEWCYPSILKSQPENVENKLDFKFSKLKEPSVILYS